MNEGGDIYYYKAFTMGRRLNNFIIRYTWLFPLLILVGAGMYYFNWFERLFTEDETAYHMAIFKELQLSIGFLLLVTAALNWALIGFWRHLYAGNCTPKWETPKNVRKQ